MAKDRTRYVCQNCGYSQVGWSGRCSNCGEWNTLVETLVSGGTGSGSKSSRVAAKVIPLASISSKQTSRISTKIPELDRVLGGGLVAGQVILLAGEPGIGKSTLLLQVVEALGGLYVSGEESASQIKIRADRLGIKNKKIELLESNDVDTTIRTAQAVENKLVIVDSIQTMATSDLSGMAGSVGQVRESAYRLITMAKSKATPLFIVGHVTKEGTVAGPSLLAHLVDTVLWFEGDKTSAFRILRAHKNRFGPTDEVGIFRMDEKGLISVKDPIEVFVNTSTKAVPGSSLTSVLEGTRPILAEIQSLVVPTKLAFPRRVVQGTDSKRLEIVLAILARRAGLPINERDVFVSIVGGITVKEPAIDLALAMSLASAYFDKPLPKQTLAIGEVDLLGEIREVNLQEKRIKEARRLGYRNIISSRDFKYISEAVKRYLR